MLTGDLAPEDVSDTTKQKLLFHKPLSACNLLVQSP